MVNNSIQFQMTATDLCKTFSKRVWLTGAVFSPVFALLINLRSATSLKDVFDVMILLVGTPFVMLIIGIISLPSALILYLTCKLVLKWNIPSVTRKLCLSLISIILTLIPIVILGNFRLSWEFAILTAPYVIVVVIAIWIYKLEIPPLPQGSPLWTATGN